MIRKAISLFNWDKAFSNSNVNEKVYIFSHTILNIPSNFISHESIMCDDRDPPWFNNKIKHLIQEKNNAYQLYRNNKANACFRNRVNFVQDSLKNLIEMLKQKYYSRIANKLTGTRKSPKSLLVFVKTVFNNKKFPIIPLFFHENIIDFKEKAELFSAFFAKQCSSIDNNSSLPNKLNNLTEKRLTKIRFSEDGIAKIIQNLDPNKAHGHDQISIRILKICGKIISKRVECIFCECLNSGLFPLEWKKANLVPVYKKGDKQCLINYRPVSLLPICGKIFEKLIFNEMFKFFNEKYLISPKPSGFKPGDSCINQLISITHEIYEALDAGFKVRSVFLDISKAFDKVWHEVVLFKLSQNGISGNLLKLLTDFLKNRKQRVTLNGQTSFWTEVNAGVPQVSILGPLLFLIYINDLPDVLSSNAKRFADDTSLFSVVHDIHSSASGLNEDLKTINDWIFQ